MAPRPAVAGGQHGSWLGLGIFAIPTHSRRDHGDSDDRRYSHRDHGDSDRRYNHRGDSDYRHSDAWRGYQGRDHRRHGSYGRHYSPPWPPYYRPYYRPFTSEYALRDALRRLFFALGYNSRGFYCSLCRYRSSRPDPFFDHLRHHHHLSYYDTLSRIHWSPAILMFVFSIR